MVSLEGPDGRPCIAFGTRYNRIYSLDVSDGSKIWEANTGGEVTVMEKVSLVPGGPPSIVAGTDAGDIVVLNTEGKRTDYLPLRSAITDIEALTPPGADRPEIAVGTADGRVVILDGSLTVRAIHVTDGKPVRRIYRGESSTQAYELTVVTGDDIRALSYRAYFLKPSRHY
jgi:outer membrane protein assembly factor BamB